MKNKAVESLIRIQFNIPEDIDVKVRCLGHTTIDSRTSYDFEIEWWKEDVRNVIAVMMPHLSVKKTDFSPKENNNDGVMTMVIM